MEKILACGGMKAIIKNLEIARRECYYLPWKGNCESCPKREHHDFKDLPDLIKKGYRTLL